MARKTKEDAQATREAILEAATAEFRERGVSRSRLEDIARRANVTRGAVYWHFKGKVDLLVALTEAITVPIYDEMDRMVANPGSDPLGAWQSHLLSSLRRLAETPRMQGILDILINHCELSDDVADLRDLENSRNQLFLDKSKALLAHAMTAGQIAGDTDLDQLSLTLHGLTHGLIRLWLRDPESFDLPETAAAGAKLIIASVRTHPGDTPDAAATTPAARTPAVQA